MQRRGLGTFGGVFTPSILTILGLILFLRLGYVVGNAGLGRAFLMLAVATGIAAATSLSLAAIATNRKVRGGGDYFLISRSLGVAFGGGIGLIVFAAQSVSVAFYCIGFGDAAEALFPDAGPGLPTTVAAGAVLVLLGVALLGADLATRFQYAIMAILFAALASFFVGAELHWDTARLEAAWNPLPGAPGFWVLFAIFFPAVTGFTQGVSMSGDLRDPARSLPSGTFLAIGLSTVIYAAVMVGLAAAMEPAELAVDYQAMERISPVPALVRGGVLAATLSSALASFLGAPRILQALAADRVFEVLQPFARTSGRAANPRRAVLLTGAIALVTIALGNLNAVASLVSMFFLISYGLLNYATYVEATAAGPSFRPTFRFFHGRASLAGTLACLAVMFAIDAVASVIAIAVLAAIHQYVERTAVPAHWRDSRRAYRFRRVKDGIRQLAGAPESPRDFQPHVLAFTESEERRERLLRYAAWITGGSGMITAVQLVEGAASLESVEARRSEAGERLASEIERQKLDAFALAVAAPDLRVASETLVQSWGVGPIRSNTVLLNWREGAWPGDEPEAASLWYARLLRSALALRQNVVVLRAEDTAWEALRATPAERRRIDVWWFDDDSSRLALLFAYLMTRTGDWDETTICIRAPAEKGKASRVEEMLRRRLTEMRIEAEVEVVEAADAEAIAQRSADATAAFLPLRLHGLRIEAPLGGSGDVGDLLARLPIVGLVAAAQDIVLRDTEEKPAPAAAPASG